MIAEETFQDLCQAADAVLDQGELSPEILAFPWLHVIRAHPQFLADYSDILSPSREASNLVTSVITLARNFAGVMKSMFQATFTVDTIALHELDDNQADVLVVSHLLNRDMFDQESDFYFGDLPKKLQHSNLSTSVVYLDHSGEASRFSFSRKRHHKTVVGIPVSIKREWGILKALGRVTFGKTGVQPDKPMLSALTHKLAKNRRSGAVRRNLRFFFDFCRILQAQQPRLFLLTYEGHAWERLAIMAARLVSPGTKCIGYMHAAIFEHQHAAFRFLPGNCNPDIIALTGETPRNIVADKLIGNGWKKTETIVIGSKKASAGNERATAAAASNSALAKGGACLVIPEGYVGESSLLFLFSLECAQRLPEQKFIWRLHPLLTFEEIQLVNSRFRQLPPNIEVSTNSLNQDMADSSVVLYRGSSAVLEAVSSGLRPVYMAIPGELSIDPLYKLETWKVRVESVEDFLGVIANTQAGDDPDLSPIRTARAFAQSYYMPLDEQPLVHLAGKL